MAQKMDIAMQGERTVVFCRSDGTDDAEQFVCQSLRKVKEHLGGDTHVSFLAFCNLCPNTFAVSAQSYIEAGYVVNEACDVPCDMFCQTLPAGLVLTYAVRGEVESRSAVHAQMRIYAEMFHYTPHTTVYEYHMMGQKTENDATVQERITMFAVSLGQE